MNANRFDTITQGLTSGTSRRQLVGGLLGGAVALLTGASVLEAKKGGNGKGRGKGKGKNKGNNGKGQPKLQFCHRGGEEGEHTLISVGAPAAKAHEKHGDTPCAPGDCQTGAATGCAEDGSCTFALAAEGTPCEFEGGSGICSAAGVCGPAPAVEE